MNYRIKTLTYQGRVLYYSPIHFYITLCDAVKKRNPYLYLYEAVEALRKEPTRREPCQTR